jgi:hypothetical protein
LWTKARAQYLVAPTEAGREQRNEGCGTSHTERSDRRLCKLDQRAPFIAARSCPSR